MMAVQVRAVQLFCSQASTDAPVVPTLCCDKVLAIQLLFAVRMFYSSTRWAVQQYASLQYSLAHLLPSCMFVAPLPPP